MCDPVLILGDCMDELPRLEDNSVHAVCTDPPYGLVEFSSGQVEKLRAGKGGVWRIPPSWDGHKRRPLPRFTVLSQEQKEEIESFFRQWATVLYPKLRPGAHVLIAGNPALQMYVQNAMVAEGFENRGTLLRIYHGFRGGDRPKNAETEFPGVCVTPRGNFEPWMLFRKPIAERTVAQNLRKWATGGLRMLDGGKPLPDVIPSFKTPARERQLANHPSLKPQHFLRIVVRSLLPLGQGTILDPFMGSGSTLAAAAAIGYEAVGIEIDPAFYELARKSVPQLAGLYVGMDGASLDYREPEDSSGELAEQLLILESSRTYSG
ncbi:site-specific DNA-methyltransferase [Candidatus Poribacteria bacterium]|nr:site-specific DNA-methyltransferase [Candidatus Poribacteria bacterium]